ncbi:MAG: methionyl-tRNA formyltransferase [Nitriliruptoraceae bacterium]
MRIGFLGTPEVAVVALRRLVEDPRIDVEVVVTNPDRPAGRGRRLVASAVKVEAEARAIDVLQPDRARDLLPELGPRGLDACAVVAYGSILPAEVLAATRLGFVNLHFSLLPRWRGAAPVQHALRAGDTTTGVTVFRLDEGMDTGPILRQRSVAISEDDDAGSLLDRLATIGADELADALVDLDAGVVPVSQPEAGVTLAPRIERADVVIDWTRPAMEISRLVRSAAPRPGATTSFRGEGLRVLSAVDADAQDSSTGASPEALVPGSIVERTRGQLAVACGDGRVLDLLRVQVAGRRVVGVNAFLNGHDPQRGEVLGCGSEGDR